MDDIRAILVVGVFGAGKTAVIEEMAELLEGREPPYAAIDLDWLAWSSAPGADHGEHALMARNLASVAANDRAAGVRRFLLAGPLADAEAIDAIRTAIGGLVHVVRLVVPLEVIEARLAASPTTGRADDLARARAWLAAGTGEGLGDQVVDNSGSLRETALRVLEAAGWLPNV